MATSSTARRFVAVLLLWSSNWLMGQAPEAEKLVPVRSMQMMDKRGNRWDLNQMGAISYGTNGCFSTGAMLQMDGNPVSFQRPMMTPDGKEFVYSTRLNGITVTRRVRLDPENGVLRYLEIFQSPAGTPLRGTATIHTELGFTPLQVLDLKDKLFAGPLGKEDGAFVAVGTDSRPSVIFIEADPKGKAKPLVGIMGNRAFDVSYSYDLPKGGSVAFVHYIAQRAGGTTADARDLLNVYAKRGRLIDPALSKDWLKVVANFSSGQAEAEEVTSPLLGPLQELSESSEIVRGRFDTVLFDVGSKLAGTITGQDFEIETMFGKTPVAFAQVAGVEGGASVMRPIRVFLRDGEILTGEVKGAKVSMATESGLRLELDLGQLNLLVMRMGELDGIAPPKARLLVTTHGGDRLALTDDGGPVEVATPWGMARVPLAELRSLAGIREPFPAHRVVLADRSRFVAMLRGGEWSAPTLRFGTVKMAPQSVRELQRIGESSAAEDDKDQPKIAGPCCEVIGESRLAGALDLPVLHLVAESNVTSITPNQIVQLDAEAAENGDRLVTVKLVDGQELKGRLTENVLPIRSGDRVWRVPAAHLVAYRVPQPEAGEAKPVGSPATSLPPGLKLPPVPSIP